MEQKFKMGDRITYDDGNEVDEGVVFLVGRRPDGVSNKIGFLAFWKNDYLKYWMDIDEPYINHYNNKSS